MPDASAWTEESAGFLNPALFFRLRFLSARFCAAVFRHLF
jgi:hypothetical protein